MISPRMWFYRFKYHYGQHLFLTKPVDVTIELSSICGNRCRYCYWSEPEKLPFSKGLMTFEKASNIINQAADLGVNSLKFNLRGESTLNPIFKDVTSYAKSLAKGSTFIERITNSNFNFSIKRNDIFEGLANQTKVKISFDSFIKDIFEKQRVGSNYEKTLANIDKFYDWPGRTTEIVIQSVRTKLNKDEDLESFIKNRWPKATLSIRDMVSGRVAKDLSSIENRTRAKERQSCLQAHVRAIFRWDGKVSPCCPSIDDSLTIGDISKQSLYEIFNSIEAINLRRSLKSKKAFDTHPCKNCSSFESYKGFKAPWGS